MLRPIIRKLIDSISPNIFSNLTCSLENDGNFAEYLILKVYLLILFEQSYWYYAIKPNLKHSELIFRRCNLYSFFMMFKKKKNE